MILRHDGNVKLKLFRNMKKAKAILTYLFTFTRPTKLFLYYKSYVFYVR